MSPDEWLLGHLLHILAGATLLLLLCKLLSMRSVWSCLKRRRMPKVLSVVAGSRSPFRYTAMPKHQRYQRLGLDDDIELALTTREAAAAAAAAIEAAGPAAASPPAAVDAAPAAATADPPSFDLGAFFGFGGAPAAAETDDDERGARPKSRRPFANGTAASPSATSPLEPTLLCPPPRVPILLCLEALAARQLSQDAEQRLRSALAALLAEELSSATVRCEGAAESSSSIRADIATRRCQLRLVLQRGGHFQWWADDGVQGGQQHGRRSAGARAAHERHLEAQVEQLVHSYHWPAHPALAAADVGVLASSQCASAAPAGAGGDGSGGGTTHLLLVLALPLPAAHLLAQLVAQRCEGVLDACASASGRLRCCALGGQILRLDGAEDMPSLVAQMREVAARLELA